MTAYTVIEYQVIVSKPGCPDIGVYNLTLYNANPRPVRHRIVEAQLELRPILCAMPGGNRVSGKAYKLKRN